MVIGSFCAGFLGSWESKPGLPHSVPDTDNGESLYKKYISV